jgi:hypothetical protein
MYGGTYTRGGAYYGGPSGARSQPLVLVSRGVPGDFIDKAQTVTLVLNDPAPGAGGPVGPGGGGGVPPAIGGPAGGPPAMAGGPPGAIPTPAPAGFAAVPGGGAVGGMPAPPPGAMPGLTIVSQIIKAEGPLEAWGTSWLGYSRYDAVVVTGAELAAAPPAVQSALWQYAETGGALVVLGAVTPPDSWKKRRSDVAGMTVYEAGFGRCLASADPAFKSWPTDRWWNLAGVWQETASPWERSMTAAEANRLFRIVEDVGIPVRGLFVLMLLFTVAIGPVNLWLLGRKRRRIWMLWTVPAISFVTCLAVFGYMLLAEGWQGHLRTEGVTLLDEGAHRATSLGWTGFYCPMAPGDGLHFSPDTEVMWQKSEDYFQPDGASCTVDWTHDQHLASGWVSARVPSHFKLRKSEVRRERLAVTRRPDGTLAAVNGLGADVRRLWLADEKGQVYTAEQVPAGGQATLTPRGDLPPARRPDALRALLNPSAWVEAEEKAAGARGLTTPAPTRGGPGGSPAFNPGAGLSPAVNPTRYLGPRTYVATLDGAPFFEDALRNAKTRRCRSVVLGILREGDDAN